MEFRVDGVIMVLDGHVLEVFGGAVGGSRRFHRDQVGMRVWPQPGGTYRVQIGLAGRRGPEAAVAVELDSAQYDEFQRFMDQLQLPE
ncbi:hypothetical protein [Pseudonocardia acidicola]|uniref:Uncharacterized protein n=1 Tax=Pseudonocardia acidicola TaxID=2724939 RepID=A0ABX1S8E9_9PSEU|nr:hypothetical protein [Pseudonocardia acidicola]NMH96661.1 hypothetical protein [Pseudonocardia acidicola]